MNGKETMRRGRHHKPPLSSALIVLGKRTTIKPDSKPEETETSSVPKILTTPYTLLGNETPAHEFLKEFYQADSDTRKEGIIHNGLRTLKFTKTKPETTLLTSFMYIAKETPRSLTSPKVFESILSFLKKEPFKKQSPITLIFIANLILELLSKSQDWPEVVAHYYIEDAIGERLWVDLPSCRKFVLNILTGFGHHFPLIRKEIEEQETLSTSEFVFPECEVKTRFTPLTQQAIRKNVITVVNESLQKRQAGTIPKSLYIFLRIACCYPEIRLIISKQFEVWLGGVKITKPLIDLLNTLVSVCHTSEDSEAMIILVTMRLKTKLSNPQYISAIQTLVSTEENLELCFRQIFLNELSARKNQVNLPLLQMMFRGHPDQCAQLFAAMSQEILSSSKDDMVKAIKQLFRELVRQVKDMNFQLVPTSLLQERNEEKFRRMDINHKPKYVLSIADLVVWVSVSIAHHLNRDLSAIGVEGNLKLNNFLSQVQSQAISWLLNTVSTFPTSEQVYNYMLRKLTLFEIDWGKDEWPNESERSALQKILQQSPILEKSIAMLCQLPHKESIQVKPLAVINLLEKMFNNCLNSRQNIQCLNTDVFPEILKLSKLPPDSGSIREESEGLEFCYVEFYWRAWVLLLIITICNLREVGREALDNYPTLKMLLEMCLTGDFKFPSTLSLCKGTTEASMLVREDTLTKQEEEEMKKSSWFSDEEVKLMIYYIRGPSRRPLASTIENLKVLNSSFSLDKQIFQCRDPDFLLEVIECQGSAGSLKWLSDVLESDSEFSVNALPCTSLCELFLSGLDEQRTTNREQSIKALKKPKLTKKCSRRQKTIIERLNSLLLLNEDESETSFTVLRYFLLRLTPFKHALIADRQLILTALESLFDCQSETDNTLLQKVSWLLNGIPSMPSFEKLKPAITELILECCMHEFQDDVMVGSLIFIDRYLPENVENFYLTLFKVLQERKFFFMFSLRKKPSSLPKELLSCLHSLVLKTTKFMLHHQEQFDKTDWLDLSLESRPAKLPNPLIIMTILTLSFDSIVNESTSGEDELFELWFPTKESSQIQMFLGNPEILPVEFILQFLISKRPFIATTLLNFIDIETALNLLTTQGASERSTKLILKFLNEKVVKSGENVKTALRLPEFTNSLSQLRNLTEFFQNKGYHEGKAFYKMIVEITGLKTPIYHHSSTNSDLQIDFFRPETVKKKTPKSENLEGKNIEQFFLQVFSNRTTFLVSDSYSYQAMLLRAITSDFLDDITQANTQQFSTINSVVNRLHKLVSSNRSGRSVLESLFQKSTWSCPIIKLLCIAHSRHGTTREWTETLHFITHYANPCGPLVPLIHEYFPETLHPLQERLREDPSKLINDILVKASRDVDKTIQLANQLLLLTADGDKFKRFDFNKLLRVVNILEEIEYRKVDQLIWHVLLTTLQHGDSQKTVNFILSLLNQQVDQTLILTLDGREFDLFKLSVGKYFDCLSLLDPDIGFSAAHYSLNKLASVLFNEWYLPYILSFFMSELSWDFVSDLLSSSAFHSSNTAYLDFLWGCLNAARLWHGRSVLNVVSPLWCFGLRKQFKLDVNENIVKILNRIYEEFKESTQMLSNQSDMALGEYLDHLDNSEANRKLFFDALYKRIPMLVVLLENSVEKQKTSIMSLIDKNDILASHFALFLYLIWPEIDIPSDSFNSLPLKFSLWHPSVCDTRLHQLLSRLVSTNDTSHSQAKFILILKRIATQHKILFLRHLPILPSFISSNSVLLKSDNIRQNQMLLSQILNLLKLLQPDIFKDIYCNALNSIFDCYFRTFSPGLKNAGYESLLDSLGEMLLFYLRSNLKQFYQFIIQHRQLLEDISTNHPKVESMQQIVTSIRYNQPNMLCINNRNFGFIFPEPPASKTLQLIPFKNRLLRHNTNETIIYVLQELEDQSIYSASILTEFAPCLHTLLVHPDQYCRKLATLLTVRHLKQNPSYCAEFIPYILRALTSGDPLMVSGIIKSLPEVIVLCSKADARKLMRSMFLISAKEFQETREELINSIKTCLADKFVC